jgi:hypothetical protein
VSKPWGDYTLSDGLYRKSSQLAKHWNKIRKGLPEARHTYKTTLHGQEVTVQVLPSAMEVDGVEWIQFTAMPKVRWVKAHRPKDVDHVDDDYEERWTRMGERVYVKEMSKPWRRMK